MKQIITLLLLLLAGFTASAQDNNGWDDWQKTSCYSKISFRIKYEGRQGTQYHWKVQFKNDYSELISFNYHVTDKMQEYATTTHRKTLNAKQVSEPLDVYTKEEDIYLLADKMSLSAYPKEFVDCDQ